MAALDVSVSVSGVTQPLQQPNPAACWAAAYTIMHSWRRKGSFTIAQALTAVGEEYVQRFRAARGLSPNEVDAFAADAGLAFRPLENPTVNGWVTLLQRHGPLMVMRGYPGTGVTHFLVIYRVFGDGTPAGTNVDFMDPLGGNRKRTDLATYGRDLHETGYTVSRSAARRAGVDLATFSQILYYP